MSETLISSLSQQDADAEQIARDFAHEFAAHRPQLLVELAKMICSLCRIPSFSRRMIENGDLPAVNAFLQKSLKLSAAKTRNSIKDLLASKAWPKVPTFFRHLIDLEWDFLSGRTKFDSFFNEFLNALTTAELPTLRYLSTAIQLEFTTVCSQQRVELLQNEHRPAILDYTKAILRNSFHDYERKVWAYSLSQMRQWFRWHALLLDEKLLRWLLWGLSDRSAPNSHLCLQISLELLDEYDDRKESLTNFIQTFVRVLTPGLATHDLNFFENLCDLAIVLHNKYEDVGKGHKFVDAVLQFTFAAERSKAKMAAHVFASTKLRNSSTFEQLRRIVQFLAPENSVFVQLFADAMIDHQLLTDWRSLTDALRELTEIAEKETLLLVIVCVVGSMLNDESPYIREEKPEIHPTDEARAAMTSALAPLLLTLSDGTASFRWKSLVVKLATYFDLERVEKAHKAKVLLLFVDTCLQGSSVDLFDIAHMSVLLQLVIDILQHDRHRAHDNAIAELKAGYEREFAQLERRLRNHPPADFTALMNGVVGVYTCRSVVSLDERCLYDIPVKLLQTEFASDDALLSFCHEVAIVMSSDYVLELLTQPDSSQCALDDRLERVQVVFSLICDCLNRRFDTRIGELAFFALCCMAKTLYAAKTSAAQRNSTFTRVVSDSMCAYVAVALRNTRVAQLAPFESSSFSLENVISCFSDLILADVLPLSGAYELLHAHCCQTTRLENQLRKFLLQLVGRRFADEIGAWIFHYFAEYFRVADENLLAELAERAKRLSQLLYAIRNSMTDVVKRVHTLGIDLAVSRSTTKGGLLSTRFLSILVEFSPCLGTETKKTCFDYFRLKQIVGDLSVAKMYINSLRVRKRRSVIYDIGSTSTEDPDEPQARRFRSSTEDPDEPEARRAESSTEDSDEPEARRSKSSAEDSDEPEVRRFRSSTEDSDEPEARRSRSSTQDLDEPEARRAGSSTEDSDEPEARRSRSSTEESDEPEARRTGSSTEDSDEPEARRSKSSAEDSDEPEVRRFRSLIEDSDQPESDSRSSKSS